MTIKKESKYCAKVAKPQLTHTPTRARANGHTQMQTPHYAYSNYQHHKNVNYNNKMINCRFLSCDRISLTNALYPNEHDVLIIL